MNNEDFFQSDLTVSNIKDLINRKWNWFLNSKVRDSGHGYFVNKKEGRILIYENHDNITEIWCSRRDYRIIFERLTRDSLPSPITFEVRSEITSGLGKFSYLLVDGPHLEHTLYASNGDELHKRRHPSHCFRADNIERYVVAIDDKIISAYHIDYNDDGSVKLADGSLLRYIPPT